MLEFFFVYFGSLLSIAAFIRFISKDLDDDLSKETRESLALRLLCLEDERKKTDLFDWVTITFNAVFGKRHFSIRCLFVSGLISVSSFTIIFLLVVWLNGEFNLSMSAAVLAKLPVIVILAAIFLNGPSDYIALLETRWIVQLNIPTIWKIILDLILTFVISLGWIALLIAIKFGPELGSSAFYGVIINPIELGRAINFDDVEEQSQASILAHVFLDILILYILTLRVVLVTSYITSIWVWLYGISELFIRLLPPSNFIITHLNVEDRPARAMGIISCYTLLTIGLFSYTAYFVFSLIN